MADDFKVEVGFEKSGAIPVIKIFGEITSEADEEILNAFNSIPTERKAKVVIDFSNTSYINSAGIATLISLITKSSDSNGRIEFSGLNSHFKKVMDIVGLTDFVVIHDTLTQAIT